MEYQKMYDEKYYAECLGEDYKKREVWLPSFRHIALKIKELINPKTVLDVGCAMGYLVEELRSLGIEAYGVDVSEYAISQVAESVKPFCRAANILEGLPESFPQRYDLVVTIEVFEHLYEQDGIKAVERVCGYADEILFAASATDFEEPTHLNVRTPDFWIGVFAQNHFFDWDSLSVDFLPPWGLHLKKQPDYPAVPQAKWVYESKQRHDDLVLTYNEMIKAQDNLKAAYDNLSSVNLTITEAHKNLENANGNLETEHLQLIEAHEKAQAYARSQVELLKKSEQELHEANQRFNELNYAHEKLISSYKELHTSYGELSSSYKELHTSYRELSASYKELSASMERLLQQNMDFQDDIQRLNETISKQEQLLRETDATKAELDDYIVSLHNRYNTDIAYYKAESLGKSLGLEAIRRSRTFRLATKFQKLARLVVPAGSRRRKAIKYFVKGIRLVRWKNFKKACVFLERYGVRGFFRKLASKLKGAPDLPADTSGDRLREAETKFEYAPLISIIVPTYNTEKRYLIKMIESVYAQSYSNWELCIADGNSEHAKEIESVLKSYKRVKYKMLSENLGISGNTNKAVELAKGEYIGLLDHDDELAPNALFEVVQGLQEHRYGFVYSDKDMMKEDSSDYFNPLFKPGYSPDLMYSANYLTHFCVFRLDILKRVGGFDKRTDGAQDWDIFLKVCEQSEKILHIPKILYHWRIIPTSVASGIEAKPYALDAQILTIQNRLKRASQEGQVEFYDKTNWQIRVKWALPKNFLVTIVIFGRDRRSTAQIISKVGHSMGSLRSEIVVVSQKPMDIKHCQLFVEESITEPVMAYNIGGYKASGDVLVFIDSAYNIFEGEYFEDLPLWAHQPEHGIIFPELLNKNKTIKSIGIIASQDDIYDFYSGEPVGYYGLMGHSEWLRNFTCCRESCFAVKSSLFRQFKGFAEDLREYAIIDFCLKADRELGRNIYLPYIKLISDHKNPELSAGNPIYRQLAAKHQLPPVDRYSNINYERLRTQALAASVEETAQESVAANTPTLPGIWDRYSSDATALAQWYDFSKRDVQNNSKIVTNEAYLHKPIKTVCWLLPDFDYASYAGLYTIFRFINYMQTQCGVKNSIAIVGQPKLDHIRKEITRIFPALKDCPLYEVQDDIQLRSVPFADAAVASLWTTAYMLLKFNKTYKKLYFIQDYEPFFYPAGATFAQAEESYKFGFLGITNTLGLKHVYESYGGRAKALTPCVDTDIFYPPTAPKDESVKRVFFYGRPGHPRNGFELGVAAFKELKIRMGKKVHIVCAGAEWNPADYGLDGVVENLGRLRYEDTGDLYRSCHAGFIMMFTKHPSYLPFELMACGCPVVSNENESTKWFLKHNENCILTQATATCIAEAIEHVLTDAEAAQRISKNAYDGIRERHTDWDTELGDLWQFISNPNLEY